MSNNQVQYFCVDEDEDGQRLDNYLLKKLKGVPKSFIYRIIRAGEVRVNKKRAKPLSRICQGDAVRVPPLRSSQTTLSERGIHPDDGKKLEWLEAHILYEDDAFLVLNKPSGLAVHGGSGVSLGIIEMLHRLRPKCRSLELGHRLDKDTSGCLLVAKKRSFLRIFHTLLRNKQVEKHYTALLAGHWKGVKRRTVEASLEKNILQSGERVVKVSEAGKAAVTHFELVKNFSNACWVNASPLTGRTHQIRVHAVKLGYPIVGDDKYGNYEVNKQMRSKGCPRLCLHAQSLKFTLPEEGTCYFEAPLDDKMTLFLANLEHSHGS